MFLGCTVFEKNAMVTCKNSKLGELCNFDFLQGGIAFFSNTVRPRSMKFGLNIHFTIYFIQTKFDVSRLHSIREKCDGNLKKFKVRTIVQLWIFAS